VVTKFNLSERYNIKNNSRTNSRNALKKRLSADIDSESGVFSISYKDIDPVFAQSVVTYCVYYIDQRFSELGVDKDKLQKENLEKSLINTYAEIIKLEQSSLSFDKTVSQSLNYPGTGSVVQETSRIKLELETQKQVYTQLRTQYEVLKVKMVSETPVFQILENADIPDQKSGPSRGKICMIITLGSFFFSLFLVFALNAFDSLKKKMIRL
jgi:hypothetical protein